MTEARRQPGNRIPVSVGLLDKKQPFDSTSYLAFHVYPSYTLLVLGLLVALLLALIWAGAHFDLLRDAVGPPPPAGGRRTFSLGRVQMAVWFYLVVAAYLYIWLITGEYNTPTASVLTLIGISAGTGLAAVFVDTSKATAASNRRAALVSRQIALTSRIAEINKTGTVTEGSALFSELQQKSSDLARVNGEIATLPQAGETPVSEGLLSDILGDGGDMSFHRFQMVAWTIVLAAIFCSTAYSQLAMPNFDPALLGLMGIRSGTYVGFKFPEK